MGDVLGDQLFSQKGEQGGELGEDENTVIVVDRLGQEFTERFQLSRIGIGRLDGSGKWSLNCAVWLALWRDFDESGVTRDLTKAKKLGRTSGPDALALADKLKATPELVAVATDVAAIIRANGEGKPSARASGNEQQINNIVDGSMASRWSVPAHSDQWIEIDYKLTRPFRQIILDNNGANWGSPEAFAVFVTDDPNSPGDARVSGSGQTGRTVINLPPGTRGRYVIIRHTVNMEDAVWSINELMVD